MNFENQIALISGGASGMGWATAQYLKQRGMKVIIWDRQAPPSDEAYAFFSCDVTSEVSVENALKETLKQCGIPRVCINCAGIAPAKKIVGKEGLAMPLGAFKEVVDVNLIGTFNVMRVIAAAMSTLELDELQERGLIINTASIAAFEGQIGQAAYSASKGGIVAMTLPAARELSAHAIRVNTIAPGLIATPLLLNMPEKVQDSLSASVVFPKRLGQPEEFASLVGEIIQNKMINGATIRLDGALRLQ